MRPSVGEAIVVMSSEESPVIIVTSGMVWAINLDRGTILGKSRIMLADRAEHRRWTDTVSFAVSS